MPEDTGGLGLGISPFENPEEFFDPASAKKNKERGQKEESKAQAELMGKVQPLISTVIDPSSDYKSRLDALASMQGIIIPELFTELTRQYPNTDRSLVAARTSITIKEMSRLLLERRAAEASDEVDPHSPKFQLVLGWFLELFQQVLSNQEGMSDVVINNVFNDLSGALMGWEDGVLKRLKGVSAKALAGVKNPFIEDFWSNVKFSRQLRDEGVVLNKGQTPAEE